MESGVPAEAKVHSGPKRVIKAVGNFFSRMGPADVSNRREFLKTSAKVLAVGGALAAGLKLNSAQAQTPDAKLQAIAKGETGETLKPSSPVLMIDFDPKVPETQFVKKLTGDKYVDEAVLRNEFGDDFKDKLPDVFKKYPETALVYGALQQFTDGKRTHGQLVSEAIQKVLKDNGLKADIQMQPIQDAFINSSFARDKLGNFQFSTTIDKQKVIEMLKDSPQEIVNISFQIGKEDVTFVQKEEKMDATVVDLDPPRPMVESAYDYDKSNNLKDLIEVCNAYPDKLFVAAAGNFGDVPLSQGLPVENLILVAQWANDAPKHGTIVDREWGVYVNNKQIGVPEDGSSFSTATITAYASRLRGKGWSIAQIRQVIMESGDIKDFKAGGYDLSGSVFDPSKIPSEPPQINKDLSNQGVNTIPLQK